MAKIFVDMLGAIIGSVGKVSYYMRYSDNIARRKGAERKSSDSPAAVEQRKRFGMLVELTQNLQPAIVIGFPQRKRGLLARNAFHHLNKDICTVEGDIITVDYEHLLCANGQLVVPDVTVSYQTANSKLAFVQTAMEEEVNCNADDLVYGVLLEKEKGFCRLVQLRVRGEGGSTSAALPQGWKKENLIVYTFALSANKKKASKSQFLELEEEA